VSVQAVRYYERLGLLPPAERADSGYRVYSPEVLERLTFIQQAQALGFSLDEIREIVRMKYAGRSPCDCVRQLLEQKLHEIDREMARLREFRQELHKTLGRSQRLPRLPHRASGICPIIQIEGSSKKEKTRGTQSRRRA
jgi:DNA-binding transcriptional MerR regulator